MESMRRGGSYGRIHVRLPLSISIVDTHNSDGYRGRYSCANNCTAKRVQRDLMQDFKWSSLREVSVAMVSLDWKWMRNKVQNASCLLLNARNLILRPRTLRDLFCN